MSVQSRINLVAGSIECASTPQSNDRFSSDVDSKNGENDEQEATDDSRRRSRYLGGLIHCPTESANIDLGSLAGYERGIDRLDPDDGYSDPSLDPKEWRDGDLA